MKRKNCIVDPERVEKLLPKLMTFTPDQIDNFSDQIDLVLGDYLEIRPPQTRAAAARNVEIRRRIMNNFKVTGRLR